MTSLENNPQSRFQLLQSAVAAPGSCVTCGTSNGPFIDFGFLAEYYGAVFFCIPCAQDCGRSAGLVDSSVVDALTKAAEVAHAELALADELVIELMGGITNAVSNFSNRILTLSSSVPSDLESNREPKAKSTESESFDSGEFGTVSTDSESSGSKGSSGVSDTTSNDGLFRDS